MALHFESTSPPLAGSDVDESYARRRQAVSSGAHGCGFQRRGTGVDADDLLLPDAIERRVNALQAMDADVAYSDWEKLVENGSGIFEIGERIARRMEDVDPSAAIAALNFWRVPFWPIQLAAFGPQPMASAGRDAPRPAFALFGRGTTDRLKK